MADTSLPQLEQLINAAWEDRSLLTNAGTIAAIEEVIERIDNGVLRTAQPTETGW
ncbi:MAG: 2,3,4,5-tetrahydropyridine-2,6-dicarboxylate N-succinyltransferase, partial [Salibacteraceae bacterium]|nr:2,3,4,5-tetrahydropyridine-2,6-dicarboxylate N-succinyltransferase [Salibacteraceae bacterium]